MTNSIIVSFIGPYGNVMLEMKEEEGRRPFIRAYESVDHAIARFEKLYESVHGDQSSGEMGDNFILDPRIHEVAGEQVSVLIADDIVDPDDFRSYAFVSPYGRMIGASAVGSMALQWHGEGIVPGYVKI
jgi:hypothetical protein